jgi:hypothetical protein
LVQKTSTIAPGKIVMVGGRLIRGWRIRSAVLLARAPMLDVPIIASCCSGIRSVDAARGRGRGRVERQDRPDCGPDAEDAAENGGANDAAVMVVA